MKILLATDHYPPYIGGAQIQSRQLARQLRDRGHNVIVVTVWQNGDPPVEDDDGIAVHKLRQLRTLRGVARMRGQHHQPPFPDPVTVVGLARLVRRLRPDVVHAYGWFSYSCAVALIGTEIPLIVTARDFGYACAKRTLMHNGQQCSGPSLGKCIGCAGRHYGRMKGLAAAVGVLASRPLLRRKVRAVHSISTYVQEVTRRDVFGAQSEASEHVIHDVIANFPEPHSAVGDGADVNVWLAQLPAEPFLLFVGALRRVKGVPELLAAYQRLVTPPPLVLLGTIEPDTPRDFPPGVLVLTDVPHEAVMEACGRCLFGVMPSVWGEPFGTVVCEVMSRGRPVIGTAPGGHTDMIVDGETGLLVPRGDVGALAAAMRTLIENPALTDRMGVAALRRSTMFTAEVSVPRLERIYAQIAGRS